jgi:extracellular factor (EF) 3-hydroxypalmitic acid methyl ester biosynthesis protein
MASNGEWKECVVVCKTSQGVELRGSLLRLTRFSVAFELYNPHAVLRTSEVLSDFRILAHEWTLYSGRAVVSSVVNSGLALVCEATLNESSWQDVGFSTEMLGNGALAAAFQGFLHEWQKLYKVRPEFKTVIADMQTFLADLRLWLDQVEVGIRAAPSGDRAQLERDVVNAVSGSAMGAIDSFIERFERIAAGLEADVEPVHRSYLRRQLHPLVLCSPFAWRAYHKPLGYAGDYEVVNMMVRPSAEGASLFAKLLNVWLLSQMPAQAHRNRIARLKERLLQETLRAVQRRRPLRVLNLGCGPAAEVEEFLAESLADQVEFTLWDFNEETLEHTARVLGEARRRHGRTTVIQLQKKSAHQVLKEGQKPVVIGSGREYDCIYCAGLFDYLSDRVCRQLMNIFYDWLAPGGLLLATNVSDTMNSTRPFRYSMEYLLDWHLIYRDGARVAALAPERAPADAVKVISEDLGVNVFLEVRKPDHV